MAHRQHQTIQELVEAWQKLVQGLADGNDEDIAAKLVGQLVANDELWFKYYESDQFDGDMQVIFDHAADLEMPNGITIADDQERAKAWNEIKIALATLNKRYL